MIFDFFPTLPMGIVIDTDGRGSKDAYTDKQQRMAEHIEESYEAKGVSEDEAASRAWATVNKIDGGGKRSGSGRGRKVNKAPMRKGARKAAKARSTAKRTIKAGGSTRRRASVNRRSPRVSSSRRRTSRSRGTKRRP